MPELFSGVLGSHKHSSSTDGGSLDHTTLIDSQSIMAYALFYGAPSS